MPQVLRQWGDVDKPKFRKHVRELGVVSESSAIDELFDLLDDDGGGSLDENELKFGLKKMMDASKTNVTSISATEKKSNVLLRTAQQQVTGVVKREKQAAEGRRLKEEEEARLEEERLAAVEAAAEKALAEAAEAEAKRAAEKAAEAGMLAAARDGGGGKGSIEPKRSKLVQRKSPVFHSAAALSKPASADVFGGGDGTMLAPGYMQAEDGALKKIRSRYLVRHTSWYETTDILVHMHAPRPRSTSPLLGAPAGDETVSGIEALW